MSYRYSCPLVCVSIHFNKPGGLLFHFLSNPPFFNTLSCCFTSLIISIFISKPLIALVNANLSFNTTSFWQYLINKDMFLTLKKEHVKQSPGSSPYIKLCIIRVFIMSTGLPKFTNRCFSQRGT